MLRFLFDAVHWFIAQTPTRVGVQLRRWFYHGTLKRVGRNLFLEEDITVLGFDRIELGNDVIIKERSFLYAVEGSLKIGDNLNANCNVMLDAGQGEISIGNNCLIGPNCVLRAADHRFDDTTIPMIQQGHRSGTIMIEDDVWLGANVVVTRDVRIGKGSVIGAQSVVTHDIPPYSIAYGVPAKVAGSRLNKHKPAEDKSLP